MNLQFAFDILSGEYQKRVKTVVDKRPDTCTTIESLDLLSLHSALESIASVIKPERAICTAEKILFAIADEKFSLANSAALKSYMVEEETV
jgi:hypothetical protein